MWINRKAYSEWAQRVQQLQEFAEGLRQQIALHTAAVAAKDRQIQLLNERITHLTVGREQMVREHAAATTMSGLLRVQINEIRHERAQFLAKLTGTILETPRIEHTPHVHAPVGTMFEDLGDAAAEHMSEGDYFPLDSAAAPTGSPAADIFDHNLDIAPAAGDTSAP